MELREFALAWKLYDGDTRQPGVAAVIDGVVISPEPNYETGGSGCDDGLAGRARPKS